MNKGILFMDAFKRHAVAQDVERGYAVNKITERLGISIKSLSSWKAQVSGPPRVPAEVLDEATETRRMKRKLARVTEEGILLKDRSGFEPS